MWRSQWKSYFYFIINFWKFTACQSSSFPTLQGLLEKTSPKSWKDDVASQNERSYLLPSKQMHKYWFHPHFGEKHNSSNYSPGHRQGTWIRAAAVPGEPEASAEELECWRHRRADDTHAEPSAVPGQSDRWGARCVLCVKFHEDPMRGGHEGGYVGVLSGGEVTSHSLHTLGHFLEILA